LPEGDATVTIQTLYQLLLLTFFIHILVVSAIGLCSADGTYLLAGVFTRALEMFWSMKNNRDRLNPRPPAASTAGHGSKPSGAIVNNGVSGTYLNGFTGIGKQCTISY